MDSTFVVDSVSVDWFDWDDLLVLGLQTTFAAVVSWVVELRRGILEEFFRNITVSAVLLSEDGATHSSLGGSPSSNTVANSLFT